MKLFLCLILTLSLVLSTKVNPLNRLKPQPSAPQANKYQLSMFYCGFGDDFCGQSSSDDVNQMADYVILAFVDTNPDGSVIMDEANFPKAQFDTWK